MLKQERLPIGHSQPPRTEPPQFHFCCEGCGSPDVHMRCERCHSSWYCSRPCQRANWLVHRATVCDRALNASAASTASFASKSLARPSDMRNNNSLGGGSSDSSSSSYSSSGYSYGYNPGYSGYSSSGSGSGSGSGSTSNNSSSSSNHIDRMLPSLPSLDLPNFDDNYDNMYNAPAIRTPFNGVSSNILFPTPNPYYRAPSVFEDSKNFAIGGIANFDRTPIKHDPDPSDAYRRDQPWLNNGAHGSPPNDPSNLREREAIRNLLDVPDVDIPVWDRQREPNALAKKLMPHQHIGLTWLINQEKSAHKGGILADDMGLGKTIQALSLILSRPPEDGTRKTTLIVVPTSLLYQWEREIDDKVKPNYKLKTFVFHSGKKRNVTVSKLLSYDVVITTYGTLAHEWKQKYDKRQVDSAILLASHAIFHRIILDEAHNIKNRNSQASKAVDRLRGTYRLCMTGTPLMNRLDELYPLIRFLRIEPYNEWESFRRNILTIKGGGTKAMNQLHVLLGRILLRRTEKTMIDGQPILTLPELTVQTIEAVFDTDQYEYYQALEQRSQLRMNKYLKEGTVMRNYWYILLLLLRLRQCCCHPHLIKDHAIPEGVNMTIEEMTKLAKKLGNRVVGRLRHQKTFECPMCNSSTENPVIIYPCGHHVCGDCISNLASSGEPGIEAEVEEGGTIIGQCPTEGCRCPIDSKQVICYKYFCEVYPPADEKDDGPAEEDEEDEDDEEDEEDSDEEDVDEEGNLKDFVVSDGYESSDREDGEDADALPADNSSTRDQSSELEDLESGLRRGNSQQQLFLPSAPLSMEDSANDSDDSLPPIDSFFAHLKQEAGPSNANTGSLLTKLSNADKKKNNLIFSRALQNSGDVDSTDDYSGATSGRKRKRCAERGKTRPKKKAKKAKKRKGKGKGKGRHTALTLGALKKSSLTSAAAKERYFNGLRKDWETSAKIDKAMEILGMIRRDFPREKILVFSQFTSFLDLMEIPISDDGYNYRRYDGSMRNGDREAAVDDFMKKPEVKLMLVSLRCGNAGLNLYAATRVILLDPFWNPSVEDQAIKRAHRLGQDRPVVAYRILVKDTVEDRILALQESKRELVSDVLNPEARKGVGRLSQSQLAGLFGINLAG